MLPVFACPGGSTTECILLGCRGYDAFVGLVTPAKNARKSTEDAHWPSSAILGGDGDHQYSKRIPPKMNPPASTPPSSGRNGLTFLPLMIASRRRVTYPCWTGKDTPRKADRSPLTPT